MRGKKKEDLSTSISFWSVLHGGNMKGDFFFFFLVWVDGLGWAGRQGCECYSWLAEGGRLAGWRVVVLMGGFAV